LTRLVGAKLKRLYFSVPFLNERCDCANILFLLVWTGRGRVVKMTTFYPDVAFPVKCLLINLLFVSIYYSRRGSGAVKMNVFYPDVHIPGVFY
jgi:hypothetical protein